MILAFMLFVATPTISTATMNPNPIEIPLPPVPMVNFGDRLYLIKKEKEKNAKHNNSRWGNFYNSGNNSTGKTVTKTIWLN